MNTDNIKNSSSSINSFIKIDYVIYKPNGNYTKTNPGQVDFYLSVLRLLL